MPVISFYGPLGAGHINPTLGIVAELVRRGHTITYYAPRMFRERLVQTGAHFVPVTSTWESMGRTTLPQMHGTEFIRAMGLLLDETKALVPVLAEAEPPDLVVHDGTLALWGRVLAHRWGVPAVETWPNLVGNEHWSMKTYAKLNPLHPRFIVTIIRAAWYLRREGITDIGSFFQGGSAAGRIVTLPRAFQPAGETFTDKYAFVGPTITDRVDHSVWQPPTDAPVLLVSLGTAYNDRPDFYRMVAASAAGRPWHVVMAVGDLVHPSTFGVLPPNVEVHAEVPQLAVLAHARAFVTHAGMGSTMEALSLQVPLVCVPQMAEQRANADRIAELGLGLNLGPDVAADALWTAVDGVAADPTVRERLAWMRGEIEAAGGSVAAADEVERVLAEASPRP